MDAGGRLHGHVLRVLDRVRRAQCHRALQLRVRAHCALQRLPPPQVPAVHAIVSAKGGVVMGLKGLGGRGVCLGSIRVFKDLWGGFLGGFFLHY